MTKIAPLSKSSPRPISSVFLALAVMALPLASCGEASDADAQPRPDTMPPVAELEIEPAEPMENNEIVGEVSSACSANLAEPFIGVKLNLDSRTELLDAIKPQAMIRFITPEEDVDLEAESEITTPGRLNIRSDETGMITEVFCG